MNAFCDCCFSAIPSDDAGIGHICAECGWETDEVENCLELADWCEEKYGEVPCGLVEGCTCHETRPCWISCGFSAANHTTIREARALYYLRSPHHLSELCLRAFLASCRFISHLN